MSEVEDVFRLFPASEHGAAVAAAFAPGPLLSGIRTPIAQRPVFLVFTNRCGSTFVAAKLSEAGYAGAPTSHRNFEFFNADMLNPWCRERGIGSLDQYVRAIAAAYAAPAGSFFSKLSLDQLVWLTRCGVIGTLMPAPVFVHVVRRDVIAQAISLVIAVQTQEWTSLHAKSAVTPQFMPNAILNVAKDVRTQEALADLYFSLTRATVLRVVYEDAVAEPDRVVREFAALSGIAPVVGAATMAVERQAGARNLEWEKRLFAFVGGRLPDLGRKEGRLF